MKHSKLFWVINVKGLKCRGGNIKINKYHQMFESALLSGLNDED